MTVHNHGPAEGRGLDCPEVRDLQGNLRGDCLGRRQGDTISRAAVLDAALALGLDPNEVESIRIDAGYVYATGRPETGPRVFRVVGE